MKDTDQKNNMFDNIIAFVKNNIKYFSAGVLLILLVLALSILDRADNRTDDLNNVAEQVTEMTEATEEESFQVDAYDNVNQLVYDYYAAYASADLATLEKLATPISQNEETYITAFSQYVEEYQNIRCYTKSGNAEGEYLVSAYIDVKFKDVETAAPGIEFFYVRTGGDGSLYIDNLYSAYNRTNQENALDSQILALIDTFKDEQDVKQLQQEVQEQYNAALAADADLSSMVSDTIPAAMQEWREALVAQLEAEASSEAASSEATDVASADDGNEAETSDGESAETTDSEIMVATDRVNVREAADISAAKLGNVEMGAKVTRIGTEGDWSIVEFSGSKGYIKSEYLKASSGDATSADNTSNDAASTDETASNGASDSATSSGSLAEGTVIRLSGAVNVRESMDENSTKLGTAYSGEKVTVVLSYAEGWTKVNWDGKIGYIKTEFLK